MGVVFDPVLGQLRTADAGGSGSGTVASVSVVTANGISGSVANPTTTPAITLTLGAITPTTVNSITLSGSATPTLAVTGTSSISGSNTGDQTTISGNAGTATKLQTARTISITGDLTYTSPSFDGSGNVTAAGTLATVNANVGSFTYGSFTVNAKGLITAASSGTAPTTYTGGNGITVTGSSIALNAPVTVANGGTNAIVAGITAFNNITGYTAAGATGTTSTNLVFSTSPTLVTPTLGAATATSINKVTITAPTTSATLTLITGSSLITAGAFALTLTSTATSNATIPSGTNTLYSTKSASITSAQLATSLTDGTGSGANVFATSPTLTTPAIGAATGTSLSVSGQLTSTVATGTAPLAVTSTTNITNLNADTVDGIHASSTATANQLFALDGNATYPQSTIQGTTLGYAQITSNFTTTGTNVQVTGLSTTVTIPAGGRRVKITGWGSNIQDNTPITNVTISIWDGAVGTGTQLAFNLGTVAGSNYSLPATVIAVVTPSAGSKTYNIGLTSGGGTAQLTASTTSPAFILVELI